MKEKNLRLRLVVRRHGLPEVRVVFTVPLDHDPTVAKLVELVNETIPLESGDWGLEDYVVELRDSEGHAFECLHFQPVVSILEKDDEVFIRPLFTEDIKKRRLSGRFQISSDGKHLIDGVAFGRQRLKAPRDRPAVHISPRKRRRLTYDDAVSTPADDTSEEEHDDESDDDDEDDDDYRDDGDSGPLLLTERGEVAEDDSEDPTSVKVAADFEDADSDGGNSADSDEEEDEEFHGLDEDNDEDMDLDDLESTIDANELNALREEVAEMEDWGDDEDTATVGLKERKGQLDLSTLDRITALRAAFPSVTVERCEKLLSKHKDDKTVYKKLAKSHQPTMDLENMLAFNTSLRQPSPAIDADEMSEDGSDDEVSSVVRHFDQHGFPPGSIAAGNALSHMAQVMQDPRALNAMRLVNKKFDDGFPTGSVSAMPQGATSPPIDEDARSSSGSSSGADSSSSSDEEEEESDSDMDSTSDDDLSSDSGSDSDSDSDSGPEEAPARPSPRRDLSDRSSDANNSDSSSSDDDASTNGDFPKSMNSLRDDVSSSDEDSSDDGSSDDSSSDDTSSSESDSESDFDSTVTTPKRTTKAVNGGGLAVPSPPVASSGRNVTALQPAPVPPGQGMSKTQKRNARRRAARQAKMASATDAADSSMQLDDTIESELLARKRALMEQFEASASQPDAEEDRSQAHVDSPQGSTAQPDVSTSQAEAPTIETPSTTSSQRKMRLDVSAGRRMLFGALGIKNPKTKPDEEKIRANLMKGIRPLVNSRIEQDSSQEAGTTSKPAPVSGNEDDEEDWRAKINYRAVECCQEGVTLSEPPFPFVQRWDPQQQGRGGKGKRKQRNQAQFYQDEDVQRKTKKRKVSQADEQTFDTSYYDEAEVSNGDIALNYDDELPVPDKDLTTADSQMTDLDDLPSLPSDLSSLPQLRVGDAQVGMVITWTAWLLSSATGWQPQVSNLTGIITNIEDDGTALEVLLARRDRNLDRNEKNYDKETGQRVYDRFEAPDLEEDEVDHNLEDEGYRKLSFSDMGDPRIVQQPLNSAQGTEVIADSQLNGRDGRGTSADKPRSQSDHSRTLGREESEKQLDNGENMEVDGLLFDSIVTNTDNGQSSLAVSTQPGQVVSVDGQPQVELRLAPTNPDTDKEAALSISSHGSNNSPSRQLEDMSEAAYAASLQASRQSSHQPGAESQPHLDSLADQDVTMDHAIAGDPRAKVDYPKLDGLSAADSVYSGRQPDLSLSNDLLNESLHKRTDTTEKPVSLENHDENVATTTKQSQPSSPARSDVSSASSIPSLSQVWHTASQVEATDAAPKPSQKPPLSTIRDEEYEAAIRKLDEASDEASENEPASAILKASPDHDTAKTMKSLANSQTSSISDPKTRPRMKKEVQTLEESISQPVLPKTRSRRPPSSPFTVPAGSQVVSLMTSSPEPDYSENYAEDSIDETYGGGKAVLNGGWTPKQRRSMRGASLPARETAKTFSTRRVTASQAPESKASVRI